jgi:hypothetical protein
VHKGPDVVIKLKVTPIWGVSRSPIVVKAKPTLLLLLRHRRVVVLRPARRVLL